MTPAKIDLTIYQGATFRKSFVWKADGVAVDLTGYTARMHIRENLEDASAAITLTTENGGITLGGNTGQIDMLITATQTAAITFSSAVYDLELVNGSEVVRFCMGKVIVSKEVTR